MKSMMIKTTLVSLLATILFGMIPSFDAFAITCGTICYHFAMRLLVGYLYDFALHNQVNYNKKWFQVGKWETKFYRFLQVRRWKKYVPTFDLAAFNLKTHTSEQLAMTMCQSELVHETIVVLSFLPLIASTWLGAPLVFLATSILSALIDSIFVILQRYNRPRFLKISKTL